MKNDKDFIKKFAGKKLYGQGGTFSPLPMISAALSAINMHRKLGISYEGFLFECKNEYLIMNYLESDLINIGNVFWKKIEKDKNILKKTRSIHKKEQINSFKLYKKIDKLNLEKLSKDQLLKLIFDAIDATKNSVGSGHVIEGIAYMGDRIVKKELTNFLGDEKVSNQAFALLTTPEEKSFLSQADDLLSKISTDIKNIKLIDKFKKDFGWIRNSYDYRRPFSNEEIVSEALSRKNQKSKTIKRLKEEKKNLIRELKLPRGIVSRLQILAFTGSWQDERKRYILLACEYLFRLLEAYSEKVGVDIKYLRYARPEELKNVGKILDILKMRLEKSFYAVSLKKTYVICGKDYNEVHKSLLKEDVVENSSEIRGMVASVGKIIGKVKILNTIESLNKVNEGDIIVASMTRPEYMTAMQKASGFITDEGGITCHAAIIAREMGKPCIIGTKMATKVLKDNDLVEVDANHGVVRILKK